MASALLASETNKAGLSNFRIWKPVSSYVTRLPLSKDSRTVESLAELFDQKEVGNPSSHLQIVQVGSDEELASIPGCVLGEL